MIRSLILAATVLPLVVACVSTTEDTDVRDLKIEPGVTTKEEVIQQLGAPRGARLQGDDVVLVFRYAEGNGTGYGLGFYAISVAVESVHNGIDFLEVVIRPDRVVRSFRLADVPHETPKWPSDD